MQRFAKVLAIGAALTGLGLVVAGTALANSAGPRFRPTVAAPVPVDWPFDDALDDLDDYVQGRCTFPTASSRSTTTGTTTTGAATESLRPPLPGRFWS
ncbi:hypothetical protein [Candidatus Mycolicibacterium alkanivorans]|uniref:Uncharacterized protein n=1 Tax=Candidatus Mycolicibacterium alkanivorans TaxID=2954114 RepID=A0ABS9YSC4_9MYCO|nr:hypothetical protein [Candidatus Mycolicibacterium alkanivorans]MCI4674105.1 hypothetical protein [Candidatus Mycolicibacterium alkanivorans]